MIKRSNNFSSQEEEIEISRDLSDYLGNSSLAIKELNNYYPTRIKRLDMEIKFLLSLPSHLILSRQQGVDLNHFWTILLLEKEKTQLAPVYCELLERGKTGAYLFWGVYDHYKDKLEIPNNYYLLVSDDRTKVKIDCRIYCDIKRYYKAFLMEGTIVLNDDILYCSDYQYYLDRSRKSIIVFPNLEYDLCTIRELLGSKCIGKIDYKELQEILKKSLLEGDYRYPIILSCPEGINGIALLKYLNLVVSEYRRIIGKELLTLLKNICKISEQDLVYDFKVVPKINHVIDLRSKVREFAIVAFPNRVIEAPEHFQAIIEYYGAKPITMKTVDDKLDGMWDGNEDLLPAELRGDTVVVLTDEIDEHVGCFQQIQNYCEKHNYRLQIGL